MEYTDLHGFPVTAKFHLNHSNESQVWIGVMDDLRLIHLNSCRRWNLNRFSWGELKHSFARSEKEIKLPDSLLVSKSSIYFGMPDTRFNKVFSPFPCSYIAYIGHDLVLHTAVPVVCGLFPSVFGIDIERLLLPSLFCLSMFLFSSTIGRHLHFVWVFDPAGRHLNTCIAVCLLLVRLDPKLNWPAYSGRKISTVSCNTSHCRKWWHFTIGNHLYNSCHNP